VASLSAWGETGRSGENKAAIPHMIVELDSLGLADNKVVQDWAGRLRNVRGFSAMVKGVVVGMAR